MSGPETLYAAMTSGDVGAVRAAETEVDDAMRAVHDAIALVRYAADKPDWSSPSARTRFNMTAWATRAAAEIAYIRLNRAKLSLQQAGDAYRAMTDVASEVIGYWRREKGKVTDPVSLLLLRAAVMVELVSVRSQYDAQLDAARDFLQTDPLTDQQEDWLENGLLRSMRRDLDGGHDPGPIIPGTLATGDDNHGWTPQGLGYDDKTGYLIQTGYNEHGQAVLSLVDPGTGELVQTVQLAGGKDAETGEAFPPPDHAGGVAVHDGTVFVTSSSSPPQVYQYPLSSIRSATPGDPVAPHGSPDNVRAGAYSTIVGDTMYVGTFDKSDPGDLYTYTWDPVHREWGNEQGPFETPAQTQGIAVRGNEVVFSTSWGRDATGTLQSYNLNDVLSGGSLGDPLQSVDLPTMAEGVAMLPQGVLTSFESGSSHYVDPDGNPLEDLWASLNMTVTPYGDLGLAGLGIDVEPATLQQASSLFDEAETALGGEEQRISGIRVPAGSLGDVPSAPAYVTAVALHCRTTARWLGQGRLASGVTASGLVASATAYEDTDHHSAGLFDRLIGLL